MAWWLASDAVRHTQLADTPERRRLWAKIANRVYFIARESELDDPEAAAIRAANATIARSHKGAI